MFTSDKANFPTFRELLFLRTLIVLLEQIPYHKLKGGILSSMAQRILRLSPAANPVIQIAVSTSAVVAKLNKVPVQLTFQWYPEKSIFNVILKMLACRIFF